MTLVLLLLTVLLLFQCLSAGKHYCHRNATYVIEIAQRPNKDETLVPSYQPSPSITPPPAYYCEWKIDLSRQENTSMQLVLFGVPMDSQEASAVSNSGGSVMRYRLPGAASDADILPGLTHVVTLFGNTKGFITVSYSDRSVQQLPSAVSLRVMIPKPGFCSPDMLSFRGNCYAASPIKSNFTAAMQSIVGSAKLASFLSDLEIKQFIAENSNKAKPYFWLRKPLNLSDPVRIGIFYRPADTNLQLLMRNLTTCWLQAVPIKRFSNLRLKLGNRSETGVLCGSLSSFSAGNFTAESVLEFVDCDIPLRWLVSFPETADAFHQRADVSCDRVISEQLALDKAPLSKSNKERTSMSNSQISPAIIISVSSFLVQIVIFVIYLFMNP